MFLHPDRRARIDAAYAEARRLVTATRAEVHRLREDRDEAAAKAREERDALPDPNVSEVDPELAQAWRAALEELHAALDTWQQDTARDLDGGLSLLARAKVLRRRVRPLASSAARTADTEDFLPELYEEAREQPARWNGTVRRGVAWIREIPVMLLDLTAIRAFVSRSLELLLVLGLWFLGRDRIRGWFRTGLAELQAARDNPRGWAAQVRRFGDRWLFPGDWRNLDPQAARLARVALDGAVALLLFRALSTSMPLLGLFALIWFGRRLVEGRPWPPTSAWPRPPSSALASGRSRRRPTTSPSAVRVGSRHGGIGRL